MPIFEYRCAACNRLYDVFHKGKEIIEDNVCPTCGSNEYTKLISVPSAPTIHNTQRQSSPVPSCGREGGCCGGECHSN